MHSESTTRWLFWWSCLTVAAACPLLLLGAQVTTMKVGMADQRAVVLPHQAIQEMAAGDQSRGWIVEHVHRLAGWFVGICGIVLALGFALHERCGGRRWLGLVALILIVLQGLLGIFRVALNAWWGTGFAWVHGAFAQIVFAVLVSVALLASPGWQRQPPLQDARPLRWLSLGCVALVFFQLVMGGLVRHLPNAWFFQFHLLGAFAVFAALLWLGTVCASRKEAFRWAPRMLLGLLVFQVLLGAHVVLNWFGRYIDPAWLGRESEMALLMRSTHYFVGSLVLATTVAIAWKAHRGVVLADHPAASATASNGLEGAR